MSRSHHSESDKLLADSNLILTYNGRGAIYQLCKQLKRRGRRIILIPAFHCPTVVDPIIALGFEPRFYSINLDLSINEDDFLSKIDADVAAAIVVNYFGFPAKLSCIKEPCQKSGVLLIEDCAHSFLSADPVSLTGDRADVAIYSFKKLVPSMVGGGIRNNRATFELNEPTESVSWKEATIQCKRLFEQAVGNLDGGLFKRAYFWVENLRARLKRKNALVSGESGTLPRIESFDYPFDVNVAEARMPWYARSILRKADLNGISRKRRANYHQMSGIFLESVGISPIYAELPDCVCPWALPLIVGDRSSIDLQLRSRGVPIFSFGETLHQSLTQDADQKSDMIEKAKFLSTNLLVIAVHQDLSPADFQVIEAAVPEVLNS